MIALTMALQSITSGWDAWREISRAFQKDSSDLSQNIGPADIDLPQAEAIPMGVAICPHHPLGCPKDCLCPKTWKPADAESEYEGTLNEPALTACTSKATHDAPSAPPLFVLESRWTLVPGLETLLPITARTDALMSADREPPQKVPIV